MEMAATAKETTKQIEGIVHAPSTSLPSLFVLFHPFVPILVVNAPHFRVGEDIVRFSYLDEFLVRAVIVGVFVGMVFLAEGAVSFFDLPLVCVFGEAE